MREILFRGKSNDTGLWVYGSLIQGRNFITGDFEFVIAEEDYAEFYPHGEISCLEKIDYNTIGQYIGIYTTSDKENGLVPIFEGDIIKTDKYIGEVIFDCGCYCVSHADGVTSIDIVTEGDTVDIEVIGNIHDNPEML